MGILELQDVSLEIDNSQILDGLSIDFWANHVHAIIGPNGAGKSSMAKAIMGLQGYTDLEGDILFKGESLRGLDPAARAERGITLAWQEPARFEGLKLRKFISCGVDNPSEQRQEEVLRQVGLDPAVYLDRAVDETLSGGERKRVELASILMIEPDLVLLDEPDSGIDVGALEKIFEAIQLLKEQGVTVLLITHSMTVLQQADHAFLICAGQLVDKGDTEKIGAYFEDECLPCDSKDPTLKQAAEHVEVGK